VPDLNGIFPAGVRYREVAGPLFVMTEGGGAILNTSYSWEKLKDPYQGDISRDLLARILCQAGIDRDEWEHL
jgi:hypothetical protein